MIKEKNVEAELYKRLTRARLDQQLGHALFISQNPEAAFFESVAFREFLQSLLCTQVKKETQPCGKCDSCGIFEGKNLTEITHPDFRCYVPESLTKGYAVDEVRQWRKDFFLTKALSPHRVVWISSAQTLALGGGHSANALLKILEEPLADSFLILTAPHSDSLLPTLRSRCHSFRIPQPFRLKQKYSQFFLQDWSPLIDWLKGNPLNTALPADQDSFWSEREKAFAELMDLKDHAWTELMPLWERFPLEKSRRVMDFFEGLEDLIASMRFYANGPLQWSQLRSRVRMK